MSRSQLTVRDRDSLHLLFEQKSARIKLDFPQLSPGQTVEWERRLDKSRSACGCELSAAFLLASIAVYGALVYAGASWLPHGLTMRAVSWLLFVVCAAVTGKILGLALARRTLQGLVADLERIISRPVPTGASLDG